MLTALFVFALLADGEVLDLVDDDWVSLPVVLVSVDCPSASAFASASLFFFQLAVLRRAKFV